MDIIYALILFLGSQTFLIKSNRLEKYKDIKFRYYLLLTLLMISLSALIGLWLGIGRFLVLTSTVLGSSVVYYRFQFKYEEMERLRG